MKNKKTNQVKIAGVTLEKNKEKNPYIPNKQEIIGCQPILKTLAYASKANKPVLLIGETGVGKTALIRHLAYKTNNGFRRLNLNGQTTTDEFVGRTLLDKQGTYWQDGVLTEAMRKGYWLLLDEINASLPEILFVLHSLLDDDGYIVLSEKDGEVVRPHKNFRLFASMNPSGKYAGTKDLNKAFLSRFPIIVQLDFPNQTTEAKIIRHYAPVSKNMAVNLVRMANDLRKSYRKDEIEFVCSPRDLINTALLADDFKNIKRALELSILSRCPEEDYKAVSTIVSLYFGTNGKMAKVMDYKKELEKLTKHIEEEKSPLTELLNISLLSLDDCLERLTKRISSTSTKEEILYQIREVVSHLEYIKDDKLKALKAKIEDL